MGLAHEGYGSEPPRGKFFQPQTKFGTKAKKVPAAPKRASRPLGIAQGDRGVVIEEYPMDCEHVKSLAKEYTFTSGTRVGCLPGLHTHRVMITHIRAVHFARKWEPLQFDFLEMGATVSLP